MTAVINSRAFYSAYNGKQHAYIMIQLIGTGGKQHEKYTHDGNRMERNYERSL